MSFGNLAQAADQTFFGVAVLLEDKADSVLVRIDSRDHLTAAANPVSSLELVGKPWSVSADLSSGLIFVKSIDYTGGPSKSYITVVDSDGMKAMRTVRLAEDRLFSNVFPSIGKDAKRSFLLISTPKETRGDGETIVVSVLDDEGTTDLLSFQLKSDDEFTTDECSGLPVSF